MIVIFNQETLNSQTTVTPEMFGANLTVATDISLRDEVIGRFDEAGITGLRFPGGSITESHFDISDIAGGSHNRTVGSFQNAPDLDLIAFSDFIDLAASVGARATLVVPTAVGFTQTAGEALLAGTYGNRSVSTEYIADVVDFVTVAMQEAEQAGVTIKAFEIGNEFWGSGRMTAHEYGNLAAVVSQTIETTLLGLGIARADQPDIVVQTLSSAGLFSPNGHSTVYVDASTGFVYEPNQIGGADTPPLSQLTEMVVPEQGNARVQNLVVISAFEQNNVIAQTDTGAFLSIDTREAANAIDGVSDHYYVSGGFDSVNTEEQFGFNQLRLWRESLGGRNLTLPELDFYITEWNSIRNGDVDIANNRGLQQAAMNVEMLFEMVSQDVTSANFWPSLFDFSRSVTLVCTCRMHLTIAGEAYSQLSQTIGMTPVLDFRDANNLSIHGFESGPESLFILSERSGAENALTLDFSTVLQPDATLYRISWTELWDGGAGGQDEVAAQTVVETELLDLVTAESLDAFLLTMQAWSLVYLRVEAVSEGVGRSVGDARRVINVVKGDDPLSLGDVLGEEDHHTHILTSRFILNGAEGDDTLQGGADDDRIQGGAGNDLILGDVGEDVAVLSTVARTSAQFRLMVDGLRVASALGTDDLVGMEWIEFSDQTVSVASLTTAIMGTPGISAVALPEGDTLVGTGDSDTLTGQAGDDVLSGGLGNDSLSGGDGNDSISASDGNDVVLGGSGHDSIGGGLGDDAIDGGDGDDVIGAGFGDDAVVGGLGHDVVAGGAGNDTLDGGDGN
uniref:calcium-binding protein n=1 Tax=Roseovarius sp. TaxID=1486281 RepID=UPI003A98732D